MYSRRSYLPCLLTVLVLTLLAAGCARTTRAPGPSLSGSSTVTAYRLNVRADHSSKAHIIEVVNQGDTVELLDRWYNWIKVRTPSRRVGWVYGAFLSGFDIPKPEKEAPEYEEGFPEGENPENMGEDKPLVL